MYVKHLPIYTDFNDFADKNSLHCFVVFSDKNKTYI